MLGSIAQDSKGHERFVKVLAGCQKENGNIVVLIENDNKVKPERYRVTLFANGTSACRHEVDGKHEGCPARGRCYHIQAVRCIASLFTENGYLAKHKAPKSMQYYYFDDEAAAKPEIYSVVNEASQVVLGAELDDVYAKLSSTKKVSTVGALNGNRGFSFWR